MGDSVLGNDGAREGDAQGVGAGTSRAEEGGRPGVVGTDGVVVGSMLKLSFLGLMSAIRYWVEIGMDDLVAGFIIPRHFWLRTGGFSCEQESRCFGFSSLQNSCLVC